MATPVLPGRRPDGSGSAAAAGGSLPGGGGPAAGRRLAVAARERLLTPLPADGAWGWLGPLLVALLAGVLRFWRLGTPPELVFDEVYYATQAASLLEHGVEVDDEGAPQYVVHPPVGKWVIAAGQLALGNDPVGWRLSVAVLGTLAVLLVARIGRRLFRSTLLGCVAGLLLALDGMHLVHSRTALLDLILGTFVLAAFGALLLDRDRARERLAARLPLPGAGRPPLPGGERPLGPRLGARPWRLLAGILLGVACATKWSGVYYVAAFGLLTVLWDVGARRAAGVRRPWRGGLLLDAPPAFAALVGVALAGYVASWAGWFAAGPDVAYGRALAEADPGPALVPGALWSLWRYHQQMWDFHTGLTAGHPYEANPWSWLVLGRPTSFSFETLELGEGGCEAQRCAQAVLAVGTPAIWWAGVGALAVLIALWAGSRDWRAGAILAGVAAGYLPWFLHQDRTVFAFYTVVFAPFLVLAVTMVLGLVLGPPRAPARRRTWGAAAAGAYLLLVVANAAWLYPVLTAEVVPYADWVARVSRWFPSWV